MRSTSMAVLVLAGSVALGPRLATAAPDLVLRRVVFAPRQDRSPAVFTFEARSTVIRLKHGADDATDDVAQFRDTLAVFAGGIPVDPPIDFEEDEAIIDLRGILRRRNRVFLTFRRMDLELGHAYELHHRTGWLWATTSLVHATRITNPLGVPMTAPFEVVEVDDLRSTAQGPSYTFGTSIEPGESESETTVQQVAAGSVSWFVPADDVSKDAAELPALGAREHDVSIHARFPWPAAFVIEPSTLSVYAGNGTNRRWVTGAAEVTIERGTASVPVFRHRVTTEVRRRATTLRDGRLTAHLWRRTAWDDPTSLPFRVETARGWTACTMGGTSWFTGTPHANTLRTRRDDPVIDDVSIVIDPETAVFPDDIDVLKASLSTVEGMKPAAAYLNAILKANERVDRRARELDVKGVGAAVATRTKAVVDYNTWVTGLWMFNADCN